jgi:Carboxypeptidase regulatory-like domain
MEMQRLPKDGAASARAAQSSRARRRLPALLVACTALASVLAAGAPAGALAAGTGAIKGLVGASETKAAIAGIEVCAQAIVEPPVAGQCAQTNASGEYEIAALSAGQYEIRFVAPEGSELNYLTQFYNGKSSKAEADPVTVVEGEPTLNIDATLEPGGAIGGTVTSAATKAALEGVRVCAHSAAREAERCANTDAAGHYVIVALPTGPYQVHFDPGAASGSYEGQYYEGQSTAEAAQALSVTAGSTTTGIDAVLQGVPVALLKPAIVGRAIEGQTLSFLAGTWTNSPTSLIDEWGRCDGTVIETCHTIATTPTYTLTSADVGHTIRIREQAFNEYGAGVPQYLFSPASAVVVAPAQADTPPATALPTTTGLGSGVLSTTASAATTAQLKALLTSLLSPRGKNAKIGALLKHRGYAISFVSLIAGRLSIAWYLVPKGAHVAAAKPVLAAVGKISTPASGASKLTVKLTAKGRSLLALGKPLKLTAKGVLAASGRPSLIVTRPFTLKR